ncbi:MAG: two-component regulator propeller domain-containing protein [Balneolaceae bacterium]
MKRIRVFFFGVIICVIPVTVLSQIEDKRFNHLSIQDGLSQSTVQAIHQDSYGYLWIGTQDGLNRYNGYDFSVYKSNPEDTGSITDNNIRVIYEDSGNTLWIGTHTNGLMKYNRDQDRFSNYVAIDDEWGGETLSDNTVWDIHEDSEGLFWIATAFGLNLMNRESETFIRIMSDNDDESTLSNNTVTKLFEDRNGTVWVGTYDGFNRYNRETNRFKRYQTFVEGDDRRSIGTVREIYQDSKGTMWIGTEDQGLFSFNPEEESFKQFIHDPANPNSLSGNAIFSILEDSHGNFWIGTGNDGLNIMDKEAGLFYRYQASSENPHSISNNGIIKVYESREEIIWFGTFAGGLNFYELSDQHFTHYQNDPINTNSISHNVVQSIQEIDQDEIWIGTDGGGLNIFNPVNETFTRFGTDRNNPSNPTSEVILDIHASDSKVYLATYGSGVDIYDSASGTFDNIRQKPETPQSLSSNYVFDIFESRDGHLWFSTNHGGVTEYDPVNEHFTHYQSNPDNYEDPESLQNNDARIVYEDGLGDIWIGTYAGVIHRLNRESGQIDAFDINANGLFYASLVQTIYENDRNQLLFGTGGGGLLRFDRNLNQVIPVATTDQSLPNNVIHTILEDKNGYLWLSTNNGLTRLNPDTDEYQNFNLEHGLGIREYNPRSGTIDRNGYIYFGGTNGFIRFHPDSIHSDSSAHPVVLTQLLLFNEPVDIGEDSPLTKHISVADKIILPYNSRVLSIDYVALNYNSIKGNQFAYRLLGFEENWNEVGNQRRATYTNLSPGEYVFQVRSTNNGGVWSDEYRSLTIQITPPFWMTYWFIGLILLIITVAVMSVYRYRMTKNRIERIALERVIMDRTKELRRSNETKNRLFSIIAHDLRNYASSIIGLATLLKESSLEDNLEEMKEYTTHLETTSIQFDDFLKNLLEWARYQTDKIKFEPKIFEVEQVISEVLNQAKPNANNKRIKLDMDIENGLEAYADSNLFAIVIFNLVNNAIKFSHKESKIEVFGKQFEKNEIEITVRDYGVGMTKDSVQKLLSDGQTFTNEGTSGEKGTGLGFDLCKDFIGKNGGQLSVESEPGKGTTVRFTLPMNEKGLNKTD